MIFAKEADPESGRWVLLYIESTGRRRISKSEQTRSSMGLMFDTSRSLIALFVPEISMKKFRFEPDLSCEGCSPETMVTVPNAVLLSTIGILETDPLLNTNIPGLPGGSPSNLVYSMMEFNMNGPILDFRV